MPELSDKEKVPVVDVSFPEELQSEWQLQGCMVHMSICQNLRVGEYIRMGHEKLKPCKAMGHIEKRHPKLIGGPSLLLRRTQLA